MEQLELPAILIGNKPESIGPDNRTGVHDTPAADPAVLVQGHVAMDDRIVPYSAAISDDHARVQGHAIAD
jgi:hypothetical protein